jgi:hypothetical protein
MENKFRLIKEYPNSPKLGTVHTYIEAGACGGDWLGTYHYKKFNEFWEEVKEVKPKIYEITGLTDGNTIFNIIEGGKKNMLWCKEGTWLNPNTTSKAYSIYSIKRLSDNEVFSIGDKVKCSMYSTTQIIKELKVVESRNTIYVSVESMEWGLDVDGIIKVKDPLFTTSDDIDIYERDKYYYIVSNSIHPQNWKPLLHVTDWDNPAQPPLGFIQFSSKELAEGYVLMNKPCLSVKELIDLDQKHPALFMYKLKELAKSKL